MARRDRGINGGSTFCGPHLEALKAHLVRERDRITVYTNGNNVVVDAYADKLREVDEAIDRFTR